MADKSLSQQLDSILKGVKREITASVDGIARDYAREAVELIQERTRAGSGIAKDGGSISSLKKLSRKYIRYRQLNSRLLSSQTSAGKSNLTFSGKLLDKLAAKRQSRGVWLIVPSNDRTAIAKYVSKARPFLFLSSTELRKLNLNAQRRFDALAKRKGFD